MRSKTKRDSSDAFFKAYDDGARILRAWFIAYGVGAPVLFLTREDVTDKITQSGRGMTIVVLFLMGVLFQVVIAAINKWANWYLYAYSEDKPEDRPWIYAVAAWISDKFVIDVACDLASLVAFTWATAEALSVFVQ